MRKKIRFRMHIRDRRNENGFSFASHKWYRITTERKKWLPMSIDSSDYNSFYLNTRMNESVFLSLSLSLVLINIFSSDLQLFPVWLPYQVQLLSQSKYFSYELINLIQMILFLVLIPLLHQIFLKLVMITKFLFLSLLHHNQ
jgi:hypothetical protein